MTDLSRSIQADTAQVSESYRGLANLRAVNRARNDRAMAGIGDSLAEMGATLRQYGSWRDAKKAEDEVRDVENANALGLQTGQPEKALVTLGAVRPTTAAGASLRSKRMNEAMNSSREQNRDNVSQAVETRAAMDWNDKKDEGRWTASAATKTPFKHPGMNSYFQEGHGTREQFFKAQEDEMTAEKQAAADAAKIERQNEMNAFREKMTTFVQGQQNARQGVGIGARKDAASEKWSLNLPFMQQALDLKNRAADRADQTLLVNATHLQNAANLDSFYATLAGLAANNKNAIEAHRETYDAARDELTTGLATAKEILRRIDMDIWRAPDEENKGLLREKASNIVRDLETQSNLLKTFKAPVALAAPPVAPTLAPIPQPGAGKKTTVGATDPAFERWKSANVPQGDSGFDYDYAAAYKAGATREKNGHMTDRFKQPWHESFSTESDLAKQFPDLAGTWSGDQYAETPAHAYMATLDDASKVRFAKLTSEQRAAVLSKVGR